MSDDTLQTASAYFERGKSCLLLGESYESLKTYAKALQISPNAQDIEKALSSVETFTVPDKLQDCDWVKKLCLIGVAAKFPESTGGKAALEQLKKLASTPYPPLEAPIVIVVGICRVEAKIRAYKDLLLDAFRNFKGTIISGGTVLGISGLIGEVQQAYPNAVRTIGYIPKTKTALVDKRYTEIRLTLGKKFSPTEPLQYWIDIIASGIRPLEVKLLSINGGEISAFECRIALALGAHVAVVKGSGMEADKLLSDADWNRSANLVSIIN